MRYFIVLVVAFSIINLSHSQDFTVASAKGKAEVGANPSAYAAAVTGSSYKLGSWAKTGAGASLVVEFSPQNSFRLLPSSEVQVEGSGVASSKFRRVVNLTVGSVDVKLNALPAGSVIQVETPTAVCGAVGTEFTADASRSTFNVTEGTVYAKSPGESALEIKKASGQFTLAPGKENSVSGGSGLTGECVLNGRPIKCQNMTFQVAKAKGSAGDSALLVSNGSSAWAKPGAYVMRDGQLEPVTGEQKVVHGQYLTAASQESALAVKAASQKASQGSVSPALQAQLNTAAAKATALRAKLFSREVIRETARDTFQQVVRPR